ncbi:MAG: adventurous gliding motility TPR repeat lipoprotein GltE [Myxococcales bacterium]|nr:adventurous gliding motility TPR repeat lipoprotein GltE [Myxococcales bacterium]
MKTRIGVVILSAALGGVLGCAGPRASGGVEVSGPKVREQPPASPSAAAVAPVETEQVPQVSPRAKLLFEDALKALEVQKKAKAIDYASVERKFQAAADADPSFGEAYYNMGVLAERRGDKKAAKAHYETALRKKPTLKQAAENLAVMAQNEGDEQGAVEVYQDILEKYPDDASSRARLAEILLRRGETERAIELAKEALFREPKTLTAYKVMMQAYYRQKQLSMAKLVALRATKLDENDPEIYYTLGLIAVAENEPAKARLHFKTAVEKRPDYLPAHLVLAKIALKQEDYMGAEESLRRLLQANGNNAETHLNLGVAYKGMGQLDKAMQAYDTAHKLSPNLPQIYLNKGIIIALKGEPEKAIDHFKQFVNLAGGEVAVPADHQVFALIREQEGVIQKRQEEKQALEEAKRMEEEMKRQEAAQQAEEKKKKEEELKKAQHDAKGKAVEEAAKGVEDGEGGGARKKCLEKAKTAKERAQCEKVETAAVKAPAPDKPEPPAPAPKREEKVAPVKGKTTEPGEPDDGL